MAIRERTKSLQLLDHIVSVLRTNLNTEITAANAEAPLVGGAASWEVDLLTDTATQIQIGDHEDFVPALPSASLVALRVTFPEANFQAALAAHVAPSTKIYRVALYTAREATGTQVLEDLVAPLYRDSLVYLEAVRSCIEEYVPSTDYGSLVLSRAYRRVIAPPVLDDPECPCTLWSKYELDFTVQMRVRQSRHASA